jgi:hypothetical protein
VESRERASMTRTVGSAFAMRDWLCFSIFHVLELEERFIGLPAATRHVIGRELRLGRHHRGAAYIRHSGVWHVGDLHSSMMMSTSCHGRCCASAMGRFWLRCSASKLCAAGVWRLFLSANCQRQSPLCFNSGSCAKHAREPALASSDVGLSSFCLFARSERPAHACRSCGLCAVRPRRGLCLHRHPPHCPGLTTGSDLGRKKRGP